MAKLILKYEDRALQEFVIGAEEVQIGRLPDNTMVIDNAAVSSRHALVMRVGESYVVKDLASTNGTFVNDTRITECFLHDGDVVQVGKHTVLFINPNQPEAPKPLPDLGGTVFLDTEAQRELLAKSPPQPAAAGSPQPRPPGPARPEPGVLTVLAGTTDRAEYVLKGQMSVIGKSDAALVRLRGWFKPRVAVMVARKGADYVVSPVAGKPQVNDRPMADRQTLQDGDIIRVSGLTLQFTRKGAG